MDGKISLLENLKYKVKYKAFPGAMVYLFIALVLNVLFQGPFVYKLFFEGQSESTQALLNNHVSYSLWVLVLTGLFYLWRFIVAWKNSAFTFEFFEEKYPKRAAEVLDTLNGNRRKAARYLNRQLQEQSRKPDEEGLGVKDDGNVPWETSFLKQFQPKNPRISNWLNSAPPKEKKAPVDAEVGPKETLEVKDAFLGRYQNIIMTVVAGAIVLLVLLYLVQSTWPAFLPLMGTGILVLLTLSGLFMLWKFKRDSVRKVTRFAKNKLVLGVLAAVILIVAAYFFGSEIDMSKLSLPEGAGENSPEQAALIPQNITRGEAATTLQSEPFEYDPTMDEAALDLSEEAYLKGLLQIQAIVEKANSAKEYMESPVPLLEESGDSFFDWALAVSGSQNSSDGDKSGELSTGLASYRRFVDNWATKGTFVKRTVDGEEKKEYIPGGFSEKLKAYLPEDSEEFILLDEAKTLLQEAALLKHELGMCLAGPAEDQPPASWNRCTELEASYNALVGEFGDLVDVLMSYLPPPPEGGEEEGFVLDKLAGFNGFVTALRGFAETERVETVYITATPPPYSQTSYSAAPDLEATAVAMGAQREAEATAAALAAEEGSGQNEVEEEPTPEPTNTLAPTSVPPTSTPWPTATPILPVNVTDNKLLPFMDDNGIEVLSTLGSVCDNTGTRPSGWPNNVRMYGGDREVNADLTDYAALYAGTDCSLKIKRGKVAGWYQSHRPGQGWLSFDNLASYEDIGATEVPFPTPNPAAPVPIDQLYTFMVAHTIWELEAENFCEPGNPYYPKGDAPSAYPIIRMYYGFSNYVVVNLGEFGTSRYAGPCGGDTTPSLTIRRSSANNSPNWDWVNAYDLWFAPFK